MDIYKNSEIRIEGEIQIRLLNQLYMEEQFNKHMYVKLEGYVQPQDAIKYEKLKLLDQKIKIFDCSNDQESLLCCCVVTEAELSAIDGMCRISLIGASASIFMDGKEKNRSFQDISETYKTILNEIPEKGSSVIYKLTGADKPTFPIIQFRETDWELIRRLAGRLHTMITAEVLSGNCSVIFGSPKGAFYKMESSQNIRFHVRKSSSGRHILSCHMMHPGNMSLGDAIVIENKKWTIGEKRVWFKNGKLEKEYTLGRMQDWELPEIFNNQLSGAAIRGKVLKRNREYLKLWLEIDKQQSADKAFWYPYLPESGNLMYSLPEEGMEATLNFPNGNECNAFVGYCIHDIRNHAELDSSIKKMQIPGDKKLVLGPESINLTSKRQRECNIISIDQQLGMAFSANRPIKFVAKDDIRIRSGLSCSVGAQCRITVKQTGDKNSIVMSGNQIRFQAERYQTSSIIHKSGPVDRQKAVSIDGQALSMLSGYFAGMMAQGECDDLSAKLLGGIPVLGPTAGILSIADQFGLNISGR